MIADQSKMLCSMTMAAERVFDITFFRTVFSISDSCDGLFLSPVSKLRWFNLKDRLMHQIKSFLVIIDHYNPLLHTIMINHDA